jgi:hypothetical protein
MDITQSIIIASITGGVSTLTTVVALKVHISYLKEGLTRVDNAVRRAHERIDSIEHNGIKACKTI